MTQKTKPQKAGNRRKSANTLFVAFLLLGVMLVMQFRTMLDSRQATEAQNIRILAEELDSELERSKELKQTLSAMETERDLWMEQLGNSGDAEWAALLAERNHTELMAGLTDVTGDGIVMILNDAAIAGNFDVEDYIIHDSDIVPLLNELRTAGAQAISINGERILATTKTVCAGPTILINGSRYPVPYEIRAIGDPAVLFSALESSETVLLMRMYNIRADIREEKGMTIGKYRILDNLDELLSGLEVVAP